MRLRCVLVLACAWLLLPSPAAAQIDDTTWGITGGFSPRWSIPGTVLADIFDASELDVDGPEFRLGVIRGRLRTGRLAGSGFDAANISRFRPGRNGPFLGIVTTRVFL